MTDSRGVNMDALSPKLYASAGLQSEKESVATWLS
jgi:hypothetical protein